MIIKDSEELRNLTGSYYANNDFRKIENILRGVEDDLAGVIGIEILTSLADEAGSEQGTSVTLETTEGNTYKVADRQFTIDEDGTLRFSDYSAYGINVRVEGDTLYVSNARALLSLKQAIAYMATMRFYRLNDISHENAGRKVKIDRENEARPFEWQLARDDRAHLDEYYRALDRLIASLQDDPRYWKTQTCRRQRHLIVADADSLAYLTGVDPSPWLYTKMIPYLDETQRLVAKAYGPGFRDGIAEAGEDLQHAAQMAVALGALALMGQRTSLQTMPYGLMKIFESDGGGNRREMASLERLDYYLKHLRKEQQYWIGEMQTLRDEAAGIEQPSRLQMPDNKRDQKFFRL